jgi:hypothetical protein
MGAGPIETVGELNAVASGVIGGVRVGATLLAAQRGGRLGADTGVLRDPDNSNNILVAFSVESDVLSANSGSTSATNSTQITCAPQSTAD